MFSTSRQLIKSSLIHRSYSTTTTTNGAPIKVTTTTTRKKVGAFRGGFIGFLLGVTTTGGLSYYYLLDQYKLANTVVIADIVALQNSITNLEKHIKSLEERK
ncbi:hypothetical protein MG5_04208 [Candida albicans P57072]|uniref:Uncharacterized protein n=3 Tax=Candida albicans TaxID=5476 RepID=Q5AGA8_CANAL|nr:uncharacterized protein CAALFM_C502580WA [Candida albicans SC5314]KGQ85217.1 hypothetical protein MEO_04144 [Candida albicans P94015]KGQ87302.1 hypothetical protein MEU_04207 [Candida albicans P37005]KGQ91579.1 hypothetical protein MG1_04205 [Candida albicans GC75]KGR06406.1 hypothetical protein MG5_04208 [Candida albicans P57072]KGR08666.1 hypothetical protein MG3_04225 [Candida albicans P78048]KGR11454.1 hypothetical protein MG9_04197 [Candida albicans P37037]KGT67494.1 hypothetical pro|eukprot:XP_720579.1 hypothetical protein CAALFM_C502580WA [Candida albicans SC5314]